jgi:hypothetical protein
MIKPPSLSAEQTLIYSGDPALNLPEDPAERDRVLDLARETGQWQSILKEGEPPTLFHCRPLYGTLWDWLLGEINRRNLVQVEAAALALGLALLRVENFGQYKVSHRTVDGQSMATTEIIDAIYREAGGSGRAVVEELGGQLIAQGLRGLRPKS